MDTAVAQSDLADLLSSGERAAFHGPPGRAVPVLEKAVALARSEGRRAELTAAAWLLGVALAAGGRFGTAQTVLAPLLAAGEDETSPETHLFGALSAATLASIARQLGRHAEARAYDERGLALAGSPEAEFECRVGLASDAIGLAEDAAARDHAEAAAATLAGHDDWWRQRVVLEWVCAELALLDGQPDVAAGHAAAAVERAEEAGAPHHVAKGLLFQGVAEVQAGIGDAPSTLRRGATLAESLSAHPLIWPSRALLGALLSGSDPDESAQCLNAARSSVLAIAGDLPAELRDEFLAQDSVGALLEA